MKRTNMGEIQEMNAGQLADKIGIEREAMRRRVRRTFPDIMPPLSVPLSADQVAKLSGQTKRKKRTTRKAITAELSAPAQPNHSAQLEAAEKQGFERGKKEGLVLLEAEKAKAKAAKKKRKLPAPSSFRSAAINILCFAIVIGHAGLIWFDCQSIWGTPGLIGGGLAFLIVSVAFLLATDPALPRTSDTALWFVLLVDCAAFFVHFPTFMRSSDIGALTTGWLCAAICACSFVALYLFRDSKLM